LDYDDFVAKAKPMFGLGVTELIIILVIVLIMFGAGKLPEIGDGIGRGIRNFRKAVKTPDEIDVTPRDEKEARGDQEEAPPKQS
jgi:sec-independent protein translocase protein TatA